MNRLEEFPTVHDARDEVSQCSSGDLSDWVAMGEAGGLAGALIDDLVLLAIAHPSVGSRAHHSPATLGVIDCRVSELLCGFRSAGECV